MVGTHLTPENLEIYVAGENEDSAREAMTRHLANCVACRARVYRAQKLEQGLRDLPLVNAPHHLNDKIIAAVDWRVSVEETRRLRMPYIAFATVASLIVSGWFLSQVMTALIEDDTVDFLSLFTSRPDLFSTYFSDALFVLIESLPLLEIAMSIFAIAIAIVLAQQLIESLQTRAARQAQTTRLI
jgi:predicted anti-sigma-YlaC factor YlaD